MTKDSCEEGCKGWRNDRCMQQAQNGLITNWSRQICYGQDLLDSVLQVPLKYQPLQCQKPLSERPPHLKEHSHVCSIAVVQDAREL